MESDKVVEIDKDVCVALFVTVMHKLELSTFTLTSEDINNSVGSVISIAEERKGVFTITCNKKQ